MHRFRSWILDPPEYRSQRNRLLPIEGGDGSTLNLDFTTGVLDSRLSFSRSSDATFIDSSGLVQWAAVNYFRNTGWTTTSTPSQWNLLIGTGTTTWHGDGSVTMDTGASLTRPAINSNTITVIQGIEYTFGYHVLAVSGSPTIATVITSSIAGETFAINGIAVSGSTIVQAGDTVSCKFKTTGTTVTPRLGPGSTNNMINTSMRITKPQMNPGEILQPYLLNTSTAAANNNTPRFEYDPTTGLLKGLLLEGSSTNLLNWSESFATTGGTNNNWSDTNITRTSTNNVDPANRTTALRITASAANGTIISTAAIGSSAQRTFSIWLRRVSGTGNIQYTLDNGTTYTTQAITSSWVRYTFESTNANQQVGIRIVTSGDSIELWGAQLEAVSGASSYIPTGANQGTRNADKMSMTDISTMQWNQTAGTFLFHINVVSETNKSLFPTFMGMYTSAPIRVVRFILNNSSGTNPRIGNDTWTATPTQILSSFVTRSTAPTPFKFAVSLSNTGQTVNQVVNAGNVTTTSGTGTMQTPTRILWHQDPSSADTEYFPIHIRSLKYWPTTLSNSQLQSLTT
jgi:hypothetical protein